MQASKIKRVNMVVKMFAVIGFKEEKAMSLIFCKKFFLISNISKGAIGT